MYIQGIEFRKLVSGKTAIAKTNSCKGLYLPVEGNRQ